MEAGSAVVGVLLTHGASVALTESVGGIRWTGEAVLSLDYPAVVGSALGDLLYLDPLARLWPIEVNPVSYASSVVAAVTGLLFLVQTPTVHTAAGFAPVLTGVGLLKRWALRSELARHVG